MRQTLHEPSGPEPSGSERSGRERSGRERSGPQRSGLLAACLIGFALGACQAAPQGAAQSGPGAQAPATQSAAEAATEAAPAEGQPAPVETAAAAQGQPGRAETAALPPAPKIDDDPARLMGLDRAGLAKLLGDPDLTRREPPAEIWQYRGGSCVFDDFLYEEAGRHRVTYLEARDGAARRVGARGCLNELLRARLAKPLG